MPKKMTSRERVLTTIHHAEPDRVPIDYAANSEIDLRLKRHYGLAPGDDEGLARALGVDFRGVDAPHVGPKTHPDLPDRKVDMWGIRKRWIEHTAGGYWDFCDFPLKDATLEEVEAWAYPSPDDFDYSRVEEKCRAVDGFCVFTGNPGLCDIINKTGQIRTMEQTLVDLITDEPAGLRLIDRRLDVQVEVMRRTLEAAKGRIDLVFIGEDLGTQIAPLISLSLFRRHIRPRMQRFVDVAMSFNLPVMVHSCGSSSWAFDDFLDMGINVVDTLQPEAAKMQPAYLKKRFGGKLAFHGMISTAGPVAYGSVDDVVKSVRDTLDIMKPGGGYCLAPTHSLQSNSPTENVVAMYDAAKKFGAY